MVLTFFHCLYLREQFIATQRPASGTAEATMQMLKAIKHYLPDNQILLDCRYIISVLSIVPQQYEAEITNISVWPQEKFKMKLKRAG